MVKRTQKEIEKDFRRIKEAAKTATSIKDLERKTGLSYAMINTTLSKHPTVFKRIKAQMSNNQEINSENKLKAIEEDFYESKAVAVKRKKVAQVATSGFVIDASITGIKELRDVLSKICHSNEKLILTSITIKELEKLQKFKDTDAHDARYILALAAENSNNFENVLIDETVGIPDDCIIKYCANNKDNVTLLTSDKTMTLKARMYGVQVQYFKQPTKATADNVTVSENAHPDKSRKKSNIRTLMPANKIGNQLVISNFENHVISISVFSDGTEYNYGIRELHIGDDVFVATKKKKYITFAHYRILSLSSQDNCELIYSRRFYDFNNFNVTDTAYESFLNAFKLKHNL